MAGNVPPSGVSKNAQSKFVNATATGNTALVPAPEASAKIRVLALVLTSTLDSTVKFQSGTTDISSAFPVGALGGMVLPFNEYGWFECAKGQALNFNQSVASITGCTVVYCLVY